MSLLAWAWLFTLPGLVLTAAGLPGRARAGWLSVPGPVVLFVVALLALLGGGSADVVYPDWLPFLPDTAYRVRADELSALMLTILGFVASLVYVYSLGYMADDPGRRRFFVYLDLFVAAMAILVLAGNLAVLLVGWTGVGISSFLLISFWRDRPGTLGAGLQALAANAIGDGALLLAAVLVPTGCSALSELGTPGCTSGFGGAELLAALLFIAAAAKSAQGPLYFWLPSAMAGPTPISALIHAATMVAAGVYLLVRTHTLIGMAPTVATWIAWIGVATTVAASVLSILQPNFKRAIAYSTVAQLGYMFAAVGVGAAFAGLFHLTTQAFFKALLFLCAGVVIHAANGEERLARLGNMRKVAPFSYWGFLIGSIALIGVPLTSGAFSKDLVIEAAVASMPLVGYLLLGSVLLTGLYTGRLFWRVYHGPAPAPAPHDGTGHGYDARAQRLMDWALVPLMAATLLGGLLVYPGEWLVDRLGGLAGEVHGIAAFSSLGLIAFALGLAGFFGSRLLPIPESPAQHDHGDSETPGAAPWVSAIASGGYAISGRLAAVQSGHLVRYAFVSVFAVGAILLLRLIVR